MRTRGAASKTIRTGMVMMAIGALVGTGPLPAQAQHTHVADASDSSAAGVVRVYMQAYNAHDVEGVAALLAAEIAWLSVVGDSVTVEMRGREAARRYLAQYFGSLPSARSEIEALTVLGPWVSVRERAHWTTATGPRSQAALSVYEIRDGQIARVWYFPSVR